MIRRLFYLPFLILTLATTACYTDDSSQPGLRRLPFEDFTDFFNDNNAKVDTLDFDADQGAALLTVGGIKIEIPTDAFSASGNVSLEIKEATSKSDFIMLNKPTVDGNTVLESSGAFSINPFVSSGSLNIENPITIRIPLPSGTTGEDMEFYNYQNEWTPDNTIDVQSDNNDLLIETDQNKWQMGAKPIPDNGTVQITINGTGYGINPHDITAFVVLSDYNSVIALETDLAGVSASGTLPKGVEMDIVVMVMDHFKLAVGTQTITFDSDANIDIPLNRTEVDEMLMTLKSLD